MPVDSSPFLRVDDVVRYLHLYRIPPIRFHQGAGELIIDQNCTFIVAIWRYESSGDGKLVTPYDPGVGNIVTGICSFCSSTTPWVTFGERLAGLSALVYPDAELRHRHEHYFRGTPGDRVYQGFSIRMYLRDTSIVPFLS